MFQNIVDYHVDIFDSDLTSVYLVIYWKTLFCYFKWFPGGRLSLCYNAVDRHVDEGNGNKNAIIWDSPITGQKSTRTYAELQDNVSKVPTNAISPYYVNSINAVLHMHTVFTKEEPWEEPSLKVPISCHVSS